MVDEDKDIGAAVVDLETEQDSLRELDAEIAEHVMGWKRNPNYKNVRVLILDMAFEWYVSGYGSNDLRHYSTNIAAAMRVEDRIAEMGKQNDYIAHLWDEIGAVRDGANFWTAQNFNAFWLCVHATPEQRCRAALKAADCLSISDRGTDGQASKNQLR